MKNFIKEEQIEIKEGILTTAFSAGTALYIAKGLMTSFKNNDAFKFGLIDEKGVRTEKEPSTQIEKDSINLLNKFIIDLKRLLLVFVRSETILKVMVSVYLIKSIKSK